MARDLCYRITSKKYFLSVPSTQNTGLWAACWHWRLYLMLQNRNGKAQACSPLWLYSSWRKATENGVCFSPDYFTFKTTALSALENSTVSGDLQRTTGHITRDWKKGLGETGPCFNQFEKGNCAYNKHHSGLQKIPQGKENKKIKMSDSNFSDISKIMDTVSKPTCFSTCHLALLKHFSDIFWNIFFLWWSMILSES